MISLIPRSDTDGEGTAVKGVFLGHQVCEESLVVYFVLQVYVKCHRLIQVIKHDTGLLRHPSIQL